MLGDALEGEARDVGGRARRAGARRTPAWRPRRDPVGRRADRHRDAATAQAAPTRNTRWALLAALGGARRHHARWPPTPTASTAAAAMRPIRPARSSATDSSCPGAQRWHSIPPRFSPTTIRRRSSQRSAISCAAARPRPTSTISVPSSSIPEPADSLAATACSCPSHWRRRLACWRWRRSTAAPAHADLKLCNGTSSRIGVAIGYQDKTGWATEGWWNLAGAELRDAAARARRRAATSTSTPSTTTAAANGPAPASCAPADKSFSIRDTADCEKRGHRRTGFMEVDTGGNRDWTVQFNDPE